MWVAACKLASVCVCVCVCVYVHQVLNTCHNYCVLSIHYPVYICVLYCINFKHACATLQSVVWLKQFRFWEKQCYYTVVCANSWVQVMICTSNNYSCACAQSWQHTHTQLIVQVHCTCNCYIHILLLSTQASNIWLIERSTCKPSIIISEIIMAV